MSCGTRTLRKLSGIGLPFGGRNLTGTAAMQCHSQPTRHPTGTAASQGCEPRRSMVASLGTGGPSWPPVRGTPLARGIVMADSLEAPRGLRQERSPRFHDRTRAGLALADRLTTHRADSDTVVLGLSNGGLVTAAAI